MGKLYPNFELDVPLPAELATSYEIPQDLDLFQSTLEPVMLEIIAHHPNLIQKLDLAPVAALPSSLQIPRKFRLYMKHTPIVQNRLKLWRSTADVAAGIPGRNLPYWQQYDPLEAGQVPYAIWYLQRFSEYITEPGLGL